MWAFGCAKYLAGLARLTGYVRSCLLITFRENTAALIVPVLSNTNDDGSGVVSGLVPKENVAAVIVVSAVTPVSIRGKVAGVIDHEPRSQMR